MDLTFWGSWGGGEILKSKLQNVESTLEISKIVSVGIQPFYKLISLFHEYYTFNLGFSKGSFGLECSYVIRFSFKLKIQKIKS